MKKRIIIFSAIFATLCAVAAVTAVVLIKNRPLDAPINLYVEDDYLKWDAVPNVKGYMVDIDDELYEVTDNTFDLLEILSEAKTYSFKVSALSSKRHRYDSDWSKTFQYSISPVVFAYESFVSGQSATLDETAWQVKVSDKDSLTGKVVIPSEIDGKPVMKIKASAFYNCQNITSVYIPDSVLYIEYYAFKGCTNLARVRLPENLDKLSLGVFENSGLKSISIPSTVETIDDLAFFGCDSLTELVIPEGVKETGLSLVGNCNNLESITIPKSLTNIENSLRAPALSEIKVADGNPVYKSEGNCLIKREGNILFSGCKSSVIPDCVEEIGEEAFYDSDIESIVISKSVNKICYNVFYGCSKLKKIAVAEDNPVFKVESNCLINKADNSALYGLEPCVIPNYVKSIADGGFYGSNIESVVIPDSVITIGKKAFNYCRQLKEITFSSDLQTSLDGFMAFCSSLEAVTIPYGVTAIENMSFFECSNLKEVYIPEGVEKIEDAFNGCNFLGLTIPDSVPVSRTTITTVLVDPFYLSLEHIWEIENDSQSYDMKPNSGLVPNCKLRYDGHYPYVYSVECNGNTWETFIHLSTVPPCRKGYTFLGWTAEEGSNEVLYPVSKHSTLDIMVAFSSEVLDTISVGDVLYAVWVAKTE